MLNRKTLLIILVASGFLYYHNFVKTVTAQTDKTYEQIKLFSEILSLIQENYVEDVDTKKLIYGAANGMVKTLDPFSQFMEPEVHKEMTTETEGEFGGLGIRISIKDDYLTVMTPIPGTPAWRLGILPDDKIIKIEGEDTRGMTLTDAVKKLRGTPGTIVNITILREGVKEPIDYAITRELIKIHVTRTKMLKDNIGYIRIIEFNKKTEEDIVTSLEELKKQGMKSLILDLRNNPGGLLDMAVEVTKKFVGDNKMVVYTKGRKGDRREYKADISCEYPDIPMVILVNKGSASGSEIVAGALQDHRRGLILGTTTFGKASVQSVIPLSDGSGLRITTAKYYTPSDKVIHQKGITPDIIIDVPKEIESKLQIQETQDEINTAKERDKTYTVSSSTTSVKKERVEDIQLTRAIELLKAQDIPLKK